jgi:toxin-antitoxin system, antitoxin component, xre family
MDYEQRLNDKQRLRFAFMLKQLREDRGLTITELSDKLGYSIASISFWENKKTNPNLYKVMDVADFFGVPLNILIGEG